MSSTSPTQTFVAGRSMKKSACNEVDVDEESSKCLWCDGSCCARTFPAAAPAAWEAAARRFVAVVVAVGREDAGTNYSCHIFVAVCVQREIIFPSLK